MPWMSLSTPPYDSVRAAAMSDSVPYVSAARLYSPAASSCSPKRRHIISGASSRPFRTMAARWSACVHNHALTLAAACCSMMLSAASAFRSRPSAASCARERPSRAALARPASVARTRTDEARAAAAAAARAAFTRSLLSTSVPAGGGVGALAAMKDLSSPMRMLSKS